MTITCITKGREKKTSSTGAETQVFFFLCFCEGIFLVWDLYPFGPFCTTRETSRLRFNKSNLVTKHILNKLLFQASNFTAFAQDIVLGDEPPSAIDESFSETRSSPLEPRVKSHGIAVALTAVMLMKFQPTLIFHLNNCD